MRATYKATRSNRLGSITTTAAEKRATATLPRCQAFQGRRTEARMLSGK